MLTPRPLMDLRTSSSYCGPRDTTLYHTIIYRQFVRVIVRVETPYLSITDNNHGYISAPKSICRGVKGYFGFGIFAIWNLDLGFWNHLKFGFGMLLMLSLKIWIWDLKIWILDLIHGNFDFGFWISSCLKLGSRISGPPLTHPYYSSGGCGVKLKKKIIQTLCTEPQKNKI